MLEKNCPFDIEPYDQSGEVKTPSLVNINYTNQDFYSMKSRLIAYIKENFQDDFNDFIESQIAIMLIENWAFIADTLSFKIDQIANEIFIDTVSEIDNAFRLSMFVGFRPLPPIAARAMWSATMSGVLTTDMVIPTPVIIDINTEDGARTIELFPADANNQPVFDDEIVIPAGSFSNTSIIGLEGRTRVQNGTGDGGLNQTVSLTYGPVIWGSVRVKVDGIQWTAVEYFTDSQPRREYRVEYDPDYNAFVIFGNNIAGLIPSPGSEIEITYRQGGGVAGNIVTGSVEASRNYIVPGFDFRVPVVMRNYTKGDFGYDGDTIDDIKHKLPKYLRTQDRVVSPEDHDFMINQFATQYSGSIGKGTAVVRNLGCAGNVIDVYILARTGTNGLTDASDELKFALKNELKSKGYPNVEYCIRDGEIIEVDISLDIILDKFYKKFEDEFVVKIQRRLNRFFSLNNWKYGKTLKALDLTKTLSDIEEVRTVEANFTTIDEDNSGTMVTAKYYQIVRPGDIEFNFVYE